MNNIKEYFDEKAPNWNKDQDITQARLYSLLSVLPIKKGDKVMDLGCGTGIISDILYEKSEELVYGIDLSDKMIEIAKETHDKNHIIYKSKDILDYNDESNFNCIVLYNAYPHFMFPRMLSKKMDELLAKDGYFVIMHSMGRVMLDKHHDAFAHEVSRHLKSPEEEYLNFKYDFDLVEAYEDDTRFLLIMKKKNYNY